MREKTACRPPCGKYGKNWALFWTPRRGRCIRQQRREAEQDLYDVWLFRRDVPLEQLTLQPSEVVGARWVSFPELLDLWRTGRLHPYLDDLDRLEQFV